MKNKKTTHYCVDNSNSVIEIILIIQSFCKKSTFTFCTLTIFWCQYFCSFACVSFLMQHFSLNPSSRALYCIETFTLMRDLSTSSTTAPHVCSTWSRLNTHDHPRPGVTPTHTCKFMSGSDEIHPSLVVCVCVFFWGGWGGGGAGSCLSSVPSSYLLVRNDRGEEEAGWWGSAGMRRQQIKR